MFFRRKRTLHVVFRECCSIHVDPLLHLFCMNLRWWWWWWWWWWSSVALEPTVNHFFTTVYPWRPSPFSSYLPSHHPSIHRRFGLPLTTLLLLSSLKSMILLIILLLPFHCRCLDHRNISALIVQMISGEIEHYSFLKPV